MEFVPSALRGLLEGRFAVTSDGSHKSKRTWQCQVCEWSCKAAGSQRALEHILPPMTTSLWEDLHEGERPSAEDLERMSKTDKRRCVRVKKCTEYVSPAVVQGLARERLPQAVAWCWGMGVVGDVPAPAAQAAAAAVPEHRAAIEQWHAISLVFSSAAFNSVSHWSNKFFFDVATNGAYKPPSKKRLQAALDTVVAKIRERKPDFMEEHKPWVLTHDSATSKTRGFQITNFYALSSDGWCLHIATKESKWLRKNAERYAGWLRAEITANDPDDKLFVGLVADSATVNKKAHAILKSNQKFAHLHEVYCGEHLASLLVGDVLKAIPWARAELTACIKVARYCKRRRKVARLLEHLQRRAKRHKSIDHIVKLRLLRKTRMLAAHDVAKGFVSNHKILKAMAVAASGKLHEAVRGSVGTSPQDQAKWKTVRAIICRRVADARAARMESILRPIKIFLRTVAQETAAFSDGALRAAQLHEHLSKALADHDFADAQSHETAATKQARAQKVDEVVSQRLASWCDDVMLTALLLDPHAHGMIAGTAPKPPKLLTMWQDAKAAARRTIERVCKPAARAAQCCQELDAYLLKSGMFERVPYLTDSDVAESPRTAITKWWRTRSPSHILHEVALYCHAQRMASTRSEIAWATLGRQLTPIRNRLEPEKVRLLQEVHGNAFLLAPRCMLKTKTHKNAKRARLWLPDENPAACGDPECSSSSDDDSSASDGGEEASNSSTSSDESKKEAGSSEDSDSE